MSTAPVNILYAGAPDQARAYAQALLPALAAKGLRADFSESHAAQDVDYIIYAPSSALQDFAPFRRAKAVLSLWAGVERIVGNATLTQPLCRMVDAGLERGMCEYVLGHVMRLHLGLDRFPRAAPHWEQVAPPLARDRVVGVMGLGALGKAAAEVLRGVGFEVLGWSRGAKTLDGITCYHGDAGLRAMLARAEIVVGLLPNTPQTESLLNAQSLALLPRGAHLINAGRGTLIDEAALLSALHSGALGSATLDVFRKEPLPEAHPFWREPKITVTPHIAAETRVSTAAEVLAENIWRFETGQTPLYLVDRARGY